jgi:hypothetical protein
MQILYGVVGGPYANVTTSPAAQRDLVFIPATDTTRCKLFGVDPVPGKVKHVLLSDDCGVTRKLHVTQGGTLLYRNDAGAFDWGHDPWVTTRQRKHPDQILAAVHASLDFAGNATGGLEAEFPEQVMIARFLDPEATVVEFGGNAGRSSLVAASLLSSDKRFVVFESDPVSAALLCRNRQANGFGFQVVDAAVSKTPLFQCGWVVSPVQTAGAHRTRTTSLAEEAPHLVFDTVIADCEGALTAIFRDFPDLVPPLGTVILENDFTVPGDKEAVDAALQAAGLGVDYSQPGGWGVYRHKFFEVWRREKS